MSDMETPDLAHIVPNFSKFSPAVIESMEMATGPPAQSLLEQSGILSRADASTPIVLLDNAAGAGLVAALFYKALGDHPPNVEVVCGDFEPKMVKLAGERIKAAGWSAEAKVVDAQAIAFPDSHFTHVLTNFVIQLLPNPGQALRESHRVLRTGGVTGFTIWTSLGWLRPFQLADPSFATPPFLTSVWVSEDALRSELSQLGFKDIKITTKEFSTRHASPKDFVEPMAGVMPIFGGERGRRVLETVKAEYGEGAFDLPGWRALVVTATKA